MTKLDMTPELAAIAADVQPERRFVLVDCDGPRTEKELRAIRAEITRKLLQLAGERAGTNNGGHRE